MTPQQLHTTCDDCISLVQHAATILQSSDLEEKVQTSYDCPYQSRLLANVASSTCHMCTILHDHIPRLIEPIEPGEEMQISTHRAFNDALAVNFELQWWEKTGQFRIYPGRLRVYQVGHGNVQILHSSKTWSLESLNSIKAWLKNCISRHDNCLKPQESQRLPLRLVDVNTADTIRNPSSDKMEQGEFDRLRVRNSNGVQVVSTEPFSPDTEYLSLSYRWGSHPSILLSTKTSFLLTEDISPHLLEHAEAAVFRHAIHVTRSLGFRYIWIDALCIMQDDETEKKAEIMRMDDIYFYSKLNISAAEADALRGLVFDRKALIANPCLTIAKIPGTGEPMSMCVFSDRILSQAALCEKPLDTRGWVYQERILSPRAIRFTKDGVYWECWSLTASEILPEGPPEKQGSIGFHFRKSIGIDPTGTDTQLIRSRWYEVLYYYSQTSLSFADDRLLTISAVAKRFCSAMRMKPSDYLAGMWKDDLPISLVWMQRDQVPGSPEPSEMRPDLEIKYAPSWSWASVMASIDWLGRGSTVATTEVVDIEVQRRSRNYFDGTNLCRLSLRGPLCRFRRHLLDGLPWIQIPQDNAFREIEEYRPGLEGRNISMYWDTARRFIADEYFLLHVGTKVQATNNEPREIGLILLRTAQHGTYRRAGSFQISLWSEYAANGSKLKDAFNGDFDTLSKEDYLELRADGRYTIDVV